MHRIFEISNFHKVNPITHLSPPKWLDGPQKYSVYRNWFELLTLITYTFYLTYFLTVSGDQWRGTWMLQQYLNLSYLLNSYNSILVTRKCQTFPHQVLLFWFLIILPDLHFTRFWCILILCNRKWNAYKFPSGSRIKKLPWKIYSRSAPCKGILIKSCSKVA